MAEFTFFQFTGFGTEHIEIGKCSKFEIRDMSSAVFEYRPGTNIKNDAITLYDWKTPTSPVAGPLQVPPPESQTIKELRLTVACLTHMLGGAVNISPWEYMAAEDRNLTVSALTDPWVLEIKVEDK